jgi:hypothetical protein
MIHLKTPTMLDYSDLKSPSLGEVSEALEKNIGLRFVQPSNKEPRRDTSSKESGSSQSSDCLQKPDSTSESKLK